MSPYSSLRTEHISLKNTTMFVRAISSSSSAVVSARRFPVSARRSLRPASFAPPSSHAPRFEKNVRGFATAGAATPPTTSSDSSSGGGLDGPSRKKALMTVTQDAAARVTELMRLDAECRGIRISLRQRGCSGLSYVMDFQKTDPGKFDEIITFTDGDEGGEQGQLFVDAKAVLFLVGTEMDYKEVEMGSEFVFNNPNQKSSCGCGQSFNV